MALKKELIYRVNSRWYVLSPPHALLSGPTPENVLSAATPPSTNECVCCVGMASRVVGVWISTIAVPALGQRYPVATFGIEEGVPPGPVTALEMGAQGRLWVGTADGGLCRLDTVMLAVFDAPSVSAMAADTDGRLWFAAGRRLVRAHGDAGDPNRRRQCGEPAHDGGARPAVGPRAHRRCEWGRSASDAGREGIV